MRNRAKCKLCQSIIESFHSTDYVACKCGEIYVDGGNAMRCGTTDWLNFLRVDDQGNEIVVKYVENKSAPAESVTIQKWMEEEMDRIPDYLQPRPPNKAELLDILEAMVNRIEQLPPDALYAAISHADFGALLILLSSILRAE
jgi:hypothetical protein